jgi:hypothetical protein
MHICPDCGETCACEGGIGGFLDAREAEDYGCCYPDLCCMPGLHFRSECHTAEDVEAGFQVEALEGRMHDLAERLAEAHALLRRAQALLVEWARFYGEGRPTPASLPPSGDIELQDDIGEALRPAKM